MQKASELSSINRQRRAGILLHPTSLPGPYTNGDIGHQAYRFIEFLHSNGFKVWQMLPLGPTHDDKSPYQCLSAHAGNPALISLDWLVDKGWLDTSKIKFKKSQQEYRAKCLEWAGGYFYQHAESEWLDLLDEFKKNHHYWLEDYALFIALKKKFNHQPWYEWPNDYRQRKQKSLSLASKELSDEIKHVEFRQFIFFQQWHEIRAYAKQHDVELFGDVPIFVAKDSADVWSKRDNFLIDQDGATEVIAGVPPDAFSDTGQRWGNPLFDWEYMQQNEFAWWLERFRTQLELFDMVRIDHFRGLQACWVIPENEKTAINGKWVEVPGKELLNSIYANFDELPLVAEDLGVITDEVIALKNYFKLPGMKVLQFAFDGNPTNPHLPHQHHERDIVYTGTHDNNTTLGWISDSKNYNADYLMEYTNQTDTEGENGVMTMIRLAFASVSFLCIVPFQDILMLGSRARMNMPGTTSGNWLWRFQWNELSQERLLNIKHLLTLYQR